MDQDGDAAEPGNERKRMGELLKRRRVQRHWRVRELARKAEMSASTLARVEAGEAGLSVEAARRLAGVLNIRDHELIGGPVSGATAVEGLARDEARLLERFAGLDSTQRRLVLDMVEQLAGSSSELAAPAAEGTVRGARAGPEAVHYVHGWTKAQALDEVRIGGDLRHVGGSQFGNRARPIRPGDVIWVAAIIEGRPHLFGRLVVASREELGIGRGDLDGVVLTQREANKVARRNGLSDIFEAIDHVFGREPAEPRRNVLIPDEVVKALEFDRASGPPRTLNIVDGMVDRQSFRSVRVLTSASAALIEQVWGSGPD